MSPDEKNLGSFEILKAVHLTWVTAVTNLACSISEKLLNWGVETRGVYRLSTSNIGRR